MEQINKRLKEYIEQEIFPTYQKNDSGHNMDHIHYVIERSLKFAKEFENINLDMVYTIASFHDLAHHLDKDNHEILSAHLFFKDEEMKKFFKESDRIIIKEAIEDHRASLEMEPRNIYGKIISSADRTTNLETILKRIHSYTMKHHPNLTLSQIIDRAYQHLKEKYGKDGYAKNYVIDIEYEQFKKDVSNILEDKKKFKNRYMEINQIIDIKEKAKQFAIHAHMGQLRKNEPDKPMIIHPISVGRLLEQYGYDDNVIAAGYLHDVIEDTKYLESDLEKEFGSDITSLVMSASEKDKSLSWEERKQHTIELTKHLPLRNKVVIVADKINNLEDLMIKFQKNGYRDFSNFKRGEEQQKWYYTSMYESLISGVDENIPIFKRLKEVLDIVFEEKEDLFLKETIFENNQEYYEKLKRLHAQKLELQNLKSLCSLTKPFVIEFAGTPRTGKTTTIANLYDFFKKGGFDICLIEEFTTSKYYKEELTNQFKDMDVCEKHLVIIEKVFKQLEEAIHSNKEIILIDRSINDRQIWNYRKYITGEISEEKYITTKEKYSSLSKELIDFLVVTYADPLTSLKRDYQCHLSLENRRFLNLKNIEEYNKSLTNIKELFLKSVENVFILDTSLLDLNTISLETASQIMPAIRKKYIRSFKEKYRLQ